MSVDVSQAFLPASKMDEKSLERNQKSNVLRPTRYRKFHELRHKQTDTTHQLACTPFSRDRPLFHARTYLSPLQLNANQPHTVEKRTGAPTQCTNHPVCRSCRTDCLNANACVQGPGIFSTVSITLGAQPASTPPFIDSQTAGARSHVPVYSTFGYILTPAFPQEIRRRPLSDTLHLLLVEGRFLATILERGGTIGRDWERAGPILTLPILDC